MESIDVKIVNGYIVSVYPDQDCESPRDTFEQSSRMNLKHREYNFPNNDNVDFDEVDTLADLVKIAVDNDAHPELIFPVEFLDHGMVGMKMWTTQAFDERHNSGMIGIVYMTNAYFKENIEPYNQTVADATKRLSADVEEYGQYVNGSCYGFIVTDKDGKELDSCWGFIGDSDDAMNEGVSSANNIDPEPEILRPLLMETAEIVRTAVKRFPGDKQAAKRYIADLLTETIK